MKRDQNKRKILVISPHFDDAVLDCADHIISWKKAGSFVKVITVFTKFSGQNISESARYYMEKSGYKNAQKFETGRKNEDIRAMNLLGVEYQYFNFTDGWFRVLNKKPIYEGEKLFAGKISKAETELLKKIKYSFQGFRSFDLICIPLGIGGHVDHLITKIVAEKVFKPIIISYYVDFPYALSYNNWQFSSLFNLAFLKRSLKKFSSQKKIVLNSYVSQIPILFPNQQNKDYKYSEILLSRK